MKAVVYDKSNSPQTLVFRDVEKPVPNDNELLVKIHAASVNAGDYRSMKMGTAVIVGRALPQQRPRPRESDYYLLLKHPITLF